MASNGDALVRAGIKAYREGNKDEARNLLLEAVDIDDQNEQAWMWLSAVVDTVEDQQTCLENVLTINPNNEKAKQGLKILSEKASSSPAVTSAPAPTSTATPPAADDDPFAQVSFAQSEPSDQSPLAADDDEEDELPDNTQWGTIETSSASALPQADSSPSAEEYDDWVVGLNLGSGDAAQVFGDVASDDDEPAFSASPFIGAESLFAEEPAFEVDDDPFSVSDDVLPPETAQAVPDDDDEVFSARSFMTDLDLEEDEQEVQEENRIDAAPIRSPAPPSSLETADNTLFGGLDAEEDFDDNLYDDFDDAEFDDVDPEELFRFIPAEIKANRLPGTRERYPALVIIGLVLLLVFNAGALTLVFITLTTG